MVDDFGASPGLRGKLLAYFPRCIVNRRCMGGSRGLGRAAQEESEGELVARRLFTSESVTEGHPDKIADQISDSILDALLAEDPKSRVAVETLITTGLVVVAGEVTTTAYVDIPGIVRARILEIGYDSSLKGFDGASCGVQVAIGSQ